MAIDLSPLWPVVARLAGVAWPPREADDLEAFFNYATRDNLLPLLLNDNAVPPEIAAWKARYRGLEELYRRRDTKGREIAARVAAILGPDATFFQKGADYRHRLYPESWLRPMADIDLLAPKDRVTEWLAKFTAAGCPRHFVTAGEHHAPGYHESIVFVDGALVEIHHSIGQRVRSGIDYRAIWDRRAAFTADGLTACHAAPADALLMDAFHLAKDEFSPPLIRYVDHALFIAACSKVLPDCVARARDWRVERALFGALHLTSTLFPALRTPAVEAALDGLLDAPRRQHLATRILPNPTHEPSGHVTGRARQLRRKFALIDQPWRRAAFVARHAYDVAAGSLAGMRARDLPFAGDSG